MNDVAYTLLVTILITALTYAAASYLWHELTDWADAEIDRAVTDALNGPALDMPISQSPEAIAWREAAVVAAAEEIAKGAA